MRSVKHDGVTWHCKASGHFHNKRRGYLHRYVWMQAYGTIPEGMVVHHIDGNPANNDLQNLEVMPKSDHQRLHAVARPSTENQRKAAGESLRSRWVEKSGQCIQCKSIFTARALVRVGRFCSSQCRERWRSPAFVPEKRNCVTCKGEYLAVRSFQKYCSVACNNKSPAREKRVFGVRASRKRRTLAQSADV